MSVVPVLGVLDTLEPIGLDELVASASLQTRVDRKYVVRRSALNAVFGGLERDARMLQIDGVHDFRYESVYFDTAELASYLAAAHRRRRRFKVRTRTYVDSDECYLEVKSPGARASTVKERHEHPVDMPDELGREGEEYAATLLDLNPRDLEPVLSTSYRRSTLYLPSSESRATIDTDLSWQLATGQLATGQLATGRRLDLPHLAIVETKSGLAASSVDRLLWRAGIRPASISKYGTGMAALVPGLPSNKWARVLREHFTPSPKDPS